MKVVEVPIEQFKQDPENANLGTPAGQEMIEQSFEEVGAGRSIMVDAQDGIIGGNKSQLAAIKAGLTKAILVESEGDALIVHRRTDLQPGDEKRERLALLDNRTSEVSLAWDFKVLKDKWDRGVSLDGLWSKAQVGLIFEQFQKDIDQPESLDNVSEQLPGAAALKIDMSFPSENPFEIPDLRADMLAELPEPIDIWCGRDASDQSWTGAWLYCYGSDSMRGLDTSRAVLAFYVDDYRFARWWEMPDIYVAKAINAGFKVAVAPNFSLYGADALAVHLYQTYKARWLGRYMQEAGIWLIPDVEWADERDLEFCMLGIPKGAPCLSMQLQAVGAYSPHQLRIEQDLMRQVLEYLGPEHVMLYGGGKKNKEIFAGAIPDRVGVTWMASRVIRRHDRAMTRPLTI